MFAPCPYNFRNSGGCESYIKMSLNCHGYLVTGFYAHNTRLPHFYLWIWIGAQDDEWNPLWGRKCRVGLIKHCLHVNGCRDKVRNPQKDVSFSSCYLSYMGDAYRGSQPFLPRLLLAFIMWCCQWWWCRIVVEWKVDHYPKDNQSFFCWSALIFFCWQCHPLAATIQTID